MVVCITQYAQLGTVGGVGWGRNNLQACTNGKNNLGKTYHHVPPQALPNWGPEACLSFLLSVCFNTHTQ